MILSAKDGLRGKFFRTDNRQEIRWVRCYDDQTHEWEAFRCDPNIAKARGIPLRSILYRGRCQLEFVPAKLLEKKPIGRVAPSTPLDEIREEILEGCELAIAKVVPIIYLADTPPVECDERFCHRPATWSVAVERLVEPERGLDGRLYERAVVIEASVWCDWHYRNPRQFSERGVESEIEVGARPQ